MNAKFFLDTNIIVYSFDPDHPAKQKKARGLIEKALKENRGVISFQVVQEFFNVALRKFQKPLSLPECQLYLDEVLWPLCEVLPSKELYQAGFHLKKETGFSFYDSIIVAASHQSGCKILYSEDLEHGRKINGLLIENPF